MKLVVAAMVAACGDDWTLADAGADAVGPDELPCDVREVLADACAHCHSSPASAGAPMPLLHRYDFFRASSVDDEHVGARSAARVHAAIAPMPPTSEPRASAEQVAILDSWIRAGMPAGTCGALPSKPLPTTCASNTFWTGGDTPHPDMNPGVSCLGCHLDHGGSRAFFFSGTVYADFHEKSLCNSPPPPGARIEILDAQGSVTLTLLPTIAGNFFSPSVAANVPLPFRARLSANGLVREMVTPQLSGDCNSCHSEQGTHQLPGQLDAPGRLVWPQPRSPVGD